MANLWTGYYVALTDDIMSDGHEYKTTLHSTGHMPYHTQDVLPIYYPIVSALYEEITEDEPYNRAAFYIGETLDGHACIKGGTYQINVGTPEVHTITVQGIYKDLSYSYEQFFPFTELVGIDFQDTAIFATNIPVFLTYEEAFSYIETGEGVENAINYQENEYDEETQKYHMYNTYGPGVYKNGNATQAGSQVSRNLIVLSKQRPVCYFDAENNFKLTTLYRGVVGYVFNSVSPFMLETIPDDEYTDGTPEYSTFYADVTQYSKCFKKYPSSGTYTYGFYLDTNFAIFADKESAENALNTGDYTQAGNWGGIVSGNTVSRPEIGPDEIATTFGAGGAISPFVQSYVLTESQVRNISDAFYTDDTSLLDNIKEGLSLFGAEPFESIVGLSAFPFDPNRMVTTSPYSYIYFGSYKYDLPSGTAARIINLAHKYLDAGGFYMKPLFNSYRDFEPFTGLMVYLPYIGWQTLDIKRYIGKYVSVRYYVDIYTRSAICCLLADGVLKDYYTGQIGVELPITGTNLSKYANDALNGLLQTAGGTVGGALSGAMAGSAIPGVGTAAGAVVGAAVGTAAGVASGAFRMSQKGTPKDKQQVKGNYTAGTGNYMTPYIIFRYEISDLIEPVNLNSLYGRPSSYGGNITSLSGFVSCETMKINTSGMTESEINETISLLKEGIFV